MSTDFQIVIIEPLSDTEEIFPDSLKVVDYKISSFYKWNRVQRFTYDKPYHYPKKDKENEHRVCILIVLQLTFQ